MRVYVTIALTACLLCAMGCRSSSTVGDPSSISRSSPHVVTLRAPEQLCAPIKTPEIVSPPLISTQDDDYLLAEDLLIIAQMDDQGGIQLHSEGARLGDVITGLVQDTDLTVIARGQGIEVPIFGIYESESKDARTFIGELAASAGMMTVEDEGILHVLDPHEAARMQRRINQRGKVPDPLVTVALPDARARSLAPALAETLLGCEERITLVHDTQTMLLHMSDARHTTLKKLVSDIDDLEPGQHITLPVEASRRQLRGVAEPRMKPCQTTRALNDFDLDGMSSIGMRMLDLLESSDKIESLVIGCGGVHPISGGMSQNAQLGDWLKAATLRTIGSNIYTTHEIATAYAIDDGGLRAPSTSHVVVALSVSRAPLLVAILREHFPELSPSLATRDVLLMRGEQAQIDAARQFVLNLDAQR